MTKHEYIASICKIVRFKSDCFKRKVGAVFVNENFEILATGYNAPPTKFPHCDVELTGNSFPGTCGNPCTRNIHAEMNAIAQAAKRGTALENSILFCTYLPCRDCSRMLVNIGVWKVYYMIGNEDQGKEVLEKGNIQIIEWDKSWKNNEV